VARGAQGDILYLDGARQAHWPRIIETSIVFSPDSRRLAYGAVKQRKAFVVVDGNAGAAFDDLASEAQIFSPDSRRLAYAARQGKTWFMVEGDRKCKTG